MTSNRDVADRYLAALCELSPQLATQLGVPGHEHELNDCSPAGSAARADLARSTLRSIGAPTVPSANTDPSADTAGASDDDRRCGLLVRDRLELGVALHDAGEELRALRIIGSPVGAVRSAFDLMPTSTDADWANIVARMRAVPGALLSIRSSLDEGRRRGLLAARRQALAVAAQAATWAGAGPSPSTPWFAGLAAKAPETIRGEADIAALGASEAMTATAAYLRESYAPLASENDAVGRDRYVLLARQFLGATLDVDDAYAYGWEELRRIESEMLALGRLLAPDASTIREVKDHLDAHGPALDGEDALQRWLQQLMDDTIARLNGTHFDIADPLRTVEAMIAPPGSAAAQYYTGPTADFSRPGRTWYPTMGATRFPLWTEKSTCFHEGVPGHHLQIAQWTYRAQARTAGADVPRQSGLAQFQRAMTVSGNIEGWALYAEQLMDELGYLDDPAYRFGYLRAQLLRAVRVIVDIGFHCGLVNPETGAVWDAETARQFLLTRTADSAAFMESEFVRYLGWPSQAICYKLGERVWLAGRDASQRRHAGAGVPFDLKRFHTVALDHGSLGLSDLAPELAAI